MTGLRCTPQPNPLLQKTVYTTDDLSTNKMILSSDVHVPAFPIADGVIMSAIGKEIWGIDIFSSSGQEKLKQTITWTGKQTQLFYSFGRSLCTYFFMDFANKIAEI